MIYSVGMKKNNFNVAPEHGRTAFYLGSETKCLCNSCRKAILEKAIERLT